MKQIISQDNYTTNKKITLIKRETNRKLFRALGRVLETELTVGLSRRLFDLLSLRNWFQIFHGVASSNNNFF